jgi:hypothetical protein
MNRQFDLFISEPEKPLIGLRIRLDRRSDRDNPCCRNICVVGPGKGPHAGILNCADCGSHRGWLRKSTAAWLGDVITRFGALPEPITVRDSSLPDEFVSVTAPSGADAV